MAEIFTYIENSDDCQFSLEELKDVCKNPAIDNRTIKLRLKLKYDDNYYDINEEITDASLCEQFIDIQQEEEDEEEREEDIIVEEGFEDYQSD
ncbi:hypothetical protein JTE90_016641 [Oedothorax gibbosus]|uniref:Uncharacterized protein n=1 Tax=Oedothorax gibbosus TaxID=931172 RepID=A0AAV6TP47_9ARAC|nr:hypothetical protein JTE90_016641 [Oedothorax gibbosus]